MKRTVAVSSLIVVSLLFTGGCTDTAATKEEKEEQNPYTEMEDPFPDADFSFTKAIAEIPDSYVTACTHAGKVTQFYYTTKNYDGDLAEEEKYAEVYTPYGYDHTKQYNIFYLMHGYGGEAEDWLGTESEPSDIKYCIDHLIAENKMGPMIIVSMTYYDNNTDEQTSNWDIALTKQFSQEFINDLMPAVESTYATYATTTDAQGLKASRDHRGFGGFSMGGVTTWYAFHDSLAYIRYFYPASGSPYWTTDIDGKDQKAGGQFAVDALQEQGYTKDDFYIYMTTGSEDYAKSIVEAQINSMLLFPDTFTFGDPSEAGVNVSYGISDGEDHNFHGRLRDLYTILPVFLRKMNS